jgi:hypothetical protein
MQSGSLFREKETVEKSLIAEIYYEKPKKDDMAVVFAFFNYVGSSRLIMNYLYTVEKMKTAKIPTFTIELVIEGDKPCIKDAYHVYGKSYLFQKENLCRIIEKQIPAKYTKLLFLDSDIIFEDSKWYTKLSDILETHDICHAFENAKWLDLTYKTVLQEAVSYVKSPNKDTLLWASNNTKYHCGFGWAFTRKSYNKSGFIDAAVIGSGDLIFSYSLFGKKYKGTQNLEMYDSSIQAWQKTFTSYDVTYLPVSIYHMHHGSLTKRQYESRNEIFDTVADITKIITKNKDGVYELTEPRFNDLLFNYFKLREDDSV